MAGAREGRARHNSRCKGENSVFQREEGSNRTKTYEIIIKLTSKENRMIKKAH